jgi:hypothetical protein
MSHVKGTILKLHRSVFQFLLQYTSSTLPCPSNVKPPPRHHSPHNTTTHLHSPSHQGNLHDTTSKHSTVTATVTFNFQDQRKGHLNSLTTQTVQSTQPRKENTSMYHTAPSGQCHLFIPHSSPSNETPFFEVPQTQSSIPDPKQRRRILPPHRGVLHPLFRKPREKVPATECHARDVHVMWKGKRGNVM